MGATWFTITFEGEPTEADFARVAELAAGGFTSGQLINDPPPRYTAHITAEAWQDDQAVEVDAPGPQERDCTEFARWERRYLNEMAEQHGEQNGEVLDGDDLFASDPAAPGWVAAWTGPFTIRIKRSTEGS